MHRRPSLRVIKAGVASVLFASCLGAIAEPSLRVGGIRFTPLPGGCFQMGSPIDEPDRDDYETPHRVCVKAFAIGTFEVTNEEFRRMVPAHSLSVNLNDGQQPAVGVTWLQAVEYAKWLSAATGYALRLPTEAEWEYAARAGTTTSRYWGNRGEGHGLAVCDKCGSPWDVVRTAPVGSLPPNPFGLHDMLGNAWEWTCSSFDADYSGGETRCAASGEGRRRVRRGGGWADDASRSRAAMRSKASIDYVSLSLGFRLVFETP